MLSMIRPVLPQHVMLISAIFINYLSEGAKSNGAKTQKTQIVGEEKMGLNNDTNKNANVEALYVAEAFPFSKKLLFMLYIEVKKDNRDIMAIAPQPPQTSRNSE